MKIPFQWRVFALFNKYYATKLQILKLQNYHVEDVIRPDEIQKISDKVSNDVQAQIKALKKQGVRWDDALTNSLIQEAEDQFEVEFSQIMQARIGDVKKNIQASSGLIFGLNRKIIANLKHEMGLSKVKLSDLEKSLLAMEANDQVKAIVENHEVRYQQIEDTIETANQLRLKIQQQSEERAI
jgi:hypothetical protein